MQSDPTTAPAPASAPIDPRWVLPLGHPAATDWRRAGGKAANLARLMAAGFPVPDGVVVTAEAYAAHATVSAGDWKAAGESILAMDLSPRVSTELASALAPFGDVPLAVRSSGIAEDLAGASFAGQYESFLGVRSHDAVVDAVRRCWASAFKQHATTYREGKNISAQPMAVLIQPMIEAEAAGVAFTANPVSGDRTETVVSAVRGLGDRLVSGEVTPDEWTVREGSALCRIAPERAIDEHMVLAVAELARRAEAHFEAPQDIEWAISGGKLYLLQARPITTLSEAGAIVPVPVPVEPPPGFWQRESVHAPQPWTPMMRSFLFPSRTEVIRRGFEEFGALIETIDFAEIGGWEYASVVPFGGKAGPPPPDWLMWLLVRIVPSMRRRLQQCATAIREDKASQLVRRWYDEWRPGHAARIAELMRVQLSMLSDAELGEHLRSMQRFADESIYVHFALGILSYTQGELAFTCRDLLGWDEIKVLDLLSGLSEKSTEPAQRLSELARMARERPAVRSLLEAGGQGAVDELAGTDREFAAAFADYQRHYGCRALRYEVADPTLAETPGLVLELVRAQVALDYDPAAAANALREKRESAVAEARATLASASPKERERFEEVLRRAQFVYPVREDNEFYAVSAPIALLRYALLELGGRLKDGGLLDGRDDVFFLEFPEALAALSNGEDCRALVSRRKGERAWVRANPGPASYGEDSGPPPSFKALPREARLFHEALLWTMDRDFESEATERGRRRGADMVLQGIAAAAGQYTGPVRVIKDESQFDKLQPGDVLVCPITSPVWSVLFPAIGALITDTGGILSHSAIIAREYGIPAVVATGNATELLRDGHVVTVDGGAGAVKL
jgi:rifampicin phosphotransferase